MSANGSEWLRKAEAAKRMGCSERHIEHLVAAGKLPAYKDGRNVRFRAEDVDAYLMARRAQPRRHQDEPKPVRVALHKVDRAREALELIREAVRAGDTSVTPMELAEAEAAVPFAELRVEAVRRQLADAAAIERRQRTDAYERQARQQKAIADEASRRSQQNAIDSGRAAATYRDLSTSGSPDAAMPWAQDALAHERRRPLVVPGRD